MVPVLVLAGLLLLWIGHRDQWPLVRRPKWAALACKLAGAVVLLAALALFLLAVAAW
jgi:hypothetical protein